MKNLSPRALAGWAGGALAVLVLLGVVALATLRGADRLPATGPPRQAGPSSEAEPQDEPGPVGLRFRGDFESGDLAGWAGDLPHRGAARVVAAPVRRGRHAVRITVAPGDRAAFKERAELRLADRSIERAHGGEGQTLWYAMSFHLPEDHEDPPEGQYPILVQWHHRPGQAAAPGRRAHVTGPPPLALFLISRGGRQSLLLVHNEGPGGPRRELGQRPIARGRWFDLLFEIRWSTGLDGRIRAWLDGEPLTDREARGPTLYNPHGNYLRLGYYRTKGGTTTNHIHLDEVRISDSRAAVER